MSGQQPARWTKPYPFDPERDYPPDGAEVDGVRFGDHYGILCWRRPDGAVARPFDPTGIALARRWAAAQA